jgi:hypothetical protein
MRIFNTTGFLCLAIVALPGCSGALKDKGAANVTSEPSGATVYANGEKLGVTPLHHELYKAFPATWNNMMFQAQGVLMVKMDGCEDYILNVNDYILSRPIHAELRCDSAVAPVLQMPAQEDAGKASQQKVTFARGQAESRLKELESLYHSGLITEDEYKTIRRRILDGL